MNLSYLTTIEVSEIKDSLNLTEEEEQVFNLLCKGKSIAAMSIELNLSETTISRRIARIKRKLARIRQ